MKRNHKSTERPLAAASDHYFIFNPSRLSARRGTSICQKASGKSPGSGSHHDEPDPLSPKCWKPTDNCEPISQKPSAKSATSESQQLPTEELSPIPQKPSGKFAVPLMLCKRKKDALIKLTFPKNANVFASEHRLYLPSKKVLCERLMQWTAEEEARP